MFAGSGPHAMMIAVRIENRMNKRVVPEPRMASMTLAAMPSLYQIRFTTAEAHRNMLAGSLKKRPLDCFDDHFTIRYMLDHFIAAV
jgi:hypothetical protein